MFPFPTREVTIYLPGQTLVVREVSAVLALVDDMGDEDKIPLWAEVWPAARGLAHYLWQMPGLSGWEVLELGAGVGLPGVVCGLKGASITFTDCVPHALELALFNARANGVERVRAELNDWRSFRPLGQFNCLIGADILYDPRFLPYLAQIFSSHLLPGGHLIVAHPGREVAFSFLKGFSQEEGWQQRVEKIKVDIPGDIRFSYEIFIHHLQRYRK